MTSLGTTRPQPVVRAPGVVLRVSSDARLTKLAVAGSASAMAAIFERYHQALHRYCFAIAGNEHDAADALQNTMIKALRSLPGETRPIALRPWLYRIAHDESVALLGARRSGSELDVAARPGDAAAGGALASRERLRSLTDDLRELTERQRGALLMRELGGMEFADIGEALQASAAAAKQSVYEARCTLQSMRAGRAMDCYTAQRAISDGDWRALRPMQMRGHLRDCASCHAFARSLHERASQLKALIPPLPAAAAAAMLHRVMGGSGTGSGGVAAGLAGSGASVGVAAKAPATPGAAR